MKDLKFKAWHLKENKMYYRAYQKLFYAILCEDDRGENDGKGLPVKRAPYGDCVLLESTGFFDKNRAEIFEGDIVRIRYKDRLFKGVVDSPPDMFGSRKIHPLQGLLKKNGITGNPENLEVEVLGNTFQTPQLLDADL